MATSGWRWENVPVPEQHLAAIAAALLAEWLLPAPVPLGRRTSRVIGWSALVTGAGLAAWAVRSASTANVAVDRPQRLVTTGAFASTRNPMYLGWTTALAGIGLARRSAWMMAAAAVAAARTHRDILAEEAALEEAFGKTFSAYAATTPRYLAAVTAQGPLTKPVVSTTSKSDPRRDFRSLS